MEFVTWEWAQKRSSLCSRGNYYGDDYDTVRQDLSVLGATHAIGTLNECLFTPRYASPGDMARDFLGSAIGGRSAETLLLRVNLCAYGQALMQGQECALTEYGLISREDGQSLNFVEQGGMEML